MKITDILYKEAMKAYKEGEVPVGCVIVCNNKIISKAHNKKQKSHLTINHAEIIAISQAQKEKKDWRLDDCELYVTLEPCKMCKEVIRQSRIKKVYYFIETKFNNEEGKKIDYEIIKNNNLEKEKYLKLIKDFFETKR